MPVIYPVDRKPEIWPDEPDEASGWDTPDETRPPEKAGEDCQESGCGLPLCLAPGRAGWLCPEGHWQLPSRVTLRNANPETVQKRPRATVATESERLSRQLERELGILRRRETLSDLRAQFTSDQVPEPWREPAREQARRLQAIATMLADSDPTATTLRALSDLADAEITSAHRVAELLRSEVPKKVPTSRQREDDIWDLEVVEDSGSHMSYLPCQLCQEQRDRSGRIPPAELRAEILAPGQWEFCSLDLCQGHYMAILSEILRQGMPEDFIRVTEVYGEVQEIISNPWPKPLALEAPQETEIYETEPAEVVREKSWSEVIGGILGRAISAYANADREINR